MTITRTIIAAAAAALALTLGGCWDDDEDVVAPAAIAEVPDSAGVSSAAFISYLLTLGAAHPWIRHGRGSGHQDQWIAV